MTDDNPRIKTIRSFVRREGRLTSGQQKALDIHWPQFGIEFDGAPLDLDRVFGRSASRVLEIGIGNGDALVQMAAAAPQLDFLGVEVHTPGIGHALREIGARELTNVRLMRHDAMEVLKSSLAAESLDRVNLYFPDPWPKKRHHKRRIVQGPFLDLVHGLLRDGGLLHMATDWAPYAEHMVETLGAYAGFQNVAAGNDLATGAVPRPDERPLTRFERRGHRHGHDVWDFKFLKR
ncbi:MAG: tRNA (guanosine(46)-N7)-methyltransferase TrmB [Gammaproteobacteria bacterium]